MEKMCEMKIQISLSVFLFLAQASLLGLSGCRSEASQALPASNLDMIALGDAGSEQAHALLGVSSEVIKGLLGESARRLLPLNPPSWEGGRLSLTLKVDPEQQNYLSARFSGDEVNENYLILFCEGKQVGYRHLGDIDVLALPDDEPRYNGRFYYVTTPLPLNLTKGKSAVKLEVRSTGHIWGYGGKWEQYQKIMTHPSRGIYRLYTHVNGCFVPPVGEKQGHVPDVTKRSAPGPEVLDQVKEKVNRTLGGFLKSTRPLNQMEVQFLARAYSVPWTTAFRSPKAVDKVTVGVDELYRRFKKDPNELWNDKATWNPGWFGVGPGADAVRRLVKELQPSMDQELDGVKTRRAAWSEMFQASRDWLCHHRRWLANQAMFTDLNLYLSHRGVAAIDPAHAWPEGKARDYLYQAVGLVPWLGNDTPQGPEKPFGGEFHQVTRKGLTKERGYVGGYGEVGLEGASDIYEATCGLDGNGDPGIKAQLVTMLRARGAFRYPMLDEDNHPAMRLETAVGWRDTHLPGYVVYAQREAGEHSSLNIAAMTLDPYAIGYVQQMFADNQFFAAAARQLKEGRLRATIGLLGLPDEYELLQKQAASPHRLPMSWDQSDFVFSDEEDGVLAIKNGQDILYASLYWRAGYAVNSLARVHYLSPDTEQVAVVREEAKFESSGQTYTRKDWINFGFSNGGTYIRYPADIHQALAGEELPIARLPSDVRFRPGEESYFAGKAEFYSLRFGSYLIGMNTTKGKTFEMVVPGDARTVKELVGKRAGVKPGSTVQVGPLSTVVFHLDD